MPLEEALDRLADFGPVDLPVVSFYLSTQADRRGRANFNSFARKELEAKSRTFPRRSPARVSFNTDAARIKANTLTSSTYAFRQSNPLASE